MESYHVYFSDGQREHKYPQLDHHNNLEKDEFYQKDHMGPRSQGATQKD